MKKALKWLGAFIFITVIGIQSVSASSLNDELTMDRNNISIEQEELLNSRNQIPLNTPVEIRGISVNSPSTLFSMRVGPFAGWDYAYVITDPRYTQTFTFVPTSNGRVVIRANNANWSGFEYFNISRRGYVYLDTRANAREFDVSKFGEDNIKIYDVQTRENLGIFRWGAFDYVTVGSGTISTYWEYIVR